MELEKNDVLIINLLVPAKYVKENSKSALLKHLMAVKFNLKPLHMALIDIDEIDKLTMKA